MTVGKGRVLEQGAFEQVLAAAFKNGVNFFDTAEQYADGEVESMLGKAIKTMHWGRSSFVLCTKLFFGGKGPNDTGCHENTFSRA